MNIFVAGGQEVIICVNIEASSKLNQVPLLFFDTTQP